MSIQDRMADLQLTSLNETTPVTHTYYVGDLCYVLNDDQWSTVCTHDFGPCPIDGEYDPQGFLEPELLEYDNVEAGKPFYIFNTAYGDGIYADTEMNMYCVDSGTIGCIRVEYADPEKLADAVERGLGHLHEFEEDFDDLCCRSEDGYISFDSASGIVEIATGGSDEWDEDEEEEEDDDA